MPRPLRRRICAATCAPWTTTSWSNSLLEESDVGGAWRVLQDHACSPSTRMAAARRRAESHPADAVPVYRTAADQLIERKNAGSYRSAAQLLRDLHTRTGDTAGFQRYLDGLRDRHRRKTRLLAELN